MNILKTHLNLLGIYCLFVNHLLKQTRLCLLKSLKFATYPMHVKLLIKSTAAAVQYANISSSLTT